MAAQVVVPLSARLDDPQFAATPVMVVEAAVVAVMVFDTVWLLTNEKITMV